MIGKNLLPAMWVLLLAGPLAGCGEVPDGAATALGGAGAASASASFSASLNGAIERELEGASSISGARFGRYHLSFAAQPDAGSDAVVISLARKDTATPQPGRYVLGETGGFDGDVMIHPGPREFMIEQGELVIATAQGDALSGQFEFSAREMGGDAGFSVKGRFQTRAAE